MTVVGTPIMGVGLPLIGGYILPSTLFYIVYIHQNRNSNIIHCSYFDSVEAKKLFCPFPNENVLDCITRRINILSSIIENREG